MDYASPRAYEVLRLTFNNNLPGASTIRAWYANSHLHAKPGINKNMLQLLEKKVTENKKSGREFVCSLAVDEMSIRRHAQWCNEQKIILGMPTYGKCRTKNTLANQAIVFMLTGVSERFQLAIAHHFVASLNGEERGKLLKNVLDEILKTGVRVICVTSDGLPANGTMYEYLGAVLDVTSDEFKPFMCLGGQKIYVIRDPPHMHKLVRNALASKSTLFDGENREIKWSYITKLVEYGKSKGLNLTHKMNLKHIQWERNIMKVDIAAQTLSASTAGSLELLLKHGEADFQNAEATIQFIHIFDKLFDVFNTKRDKENTQNIFKIPLSSSNSVEIFAFFEKAITYIERLYIIDGDTGSRNPLIDSTIKMGFTGYISNMKTLMLINEDYIRGGVMSTIPVYYLGQDRLEMLFGRIRSHLGYNDNPTVQQFSGTLRKLTAFDSLLCSKYSNCNEIDIPNEPFANIMYISSRKKEREKEQEDISAAELTTLHCKLSEMEIIENSSVLDSFKDYTTIYICNEIEQRISKEDRVYCNYCKNIFQDNKKVPKSYLSSKVTGIPCQSTFLICKEASRLLDLRISSEIDVRQLRSGIFSRLDIQDLYPDTDFSHDFDHKLYAIRAIIDLFIQIKGTFLAKQMTFDAHQQLIRSKMKKLVHVYGQ